MRYSNIVEPPSFHVRIIVFVLVLDVQCSSFWYHHLLTSYHQPYFTTLANVIIIYYVKIMWL